MRRFYFLINLFTAILNCGLFVFSYYFDFFSLEFSLWISLCSVVVIILQAFFSQYNFFSIINFFNGFCLLFLYGNILNYFVFNISDFNFFHLFEGFYVPNYAFISSLYLINLGVSLVNIVFIKNYNNNNKIQIKKSNVPKYLLSLFLIFSSLALFKFYLEFKYILSVGYVNFYLNGFDNINYYSPIIKNSHTVLLVFYGLLLSYFPQKKIFILATVVFNIVMIFHGLKGARVLILLPILFSLWFYSRFYSKNKNINYFKLGSIFCIFFILQSLKSFRTNQENDITFENVFSYALAETGSTQKLVALYLDEKDNFKITYPYVLEPILYPFFYVKNFKVYKGGQSEELAKTRNSLNHKLSFYLNPSYYLKGNGLGSSMIAESFQYGLLYFILIMLFFGYIITLFENSISKPLIILSPYIFNGLVFAPRDTPFPNTWGILKIYIIIFILYFIIYILKQNSTTTVNV